jgi:bifunctional non-homologous end joining protein LigD
MHLAGLTAEWRRRMAEAKVAGVRISSPDDVLYPGQGITKRELAEYYAAVAEHILPELRGRPVTLVRCPEGEGEECFYQRHAKEQGPFAPLGRVSLDEGDGSRADFLTVPNRKALLTLAQMRVLEVHVWNARIDRPDRPDRMVLDLDPGPGVEWSGILDAAFWFREKLRSMGLASFAKTTGGKGLHVVVPLARRFEWDRVKAFSRAIAECAAKEAPERFLSHAAKADRHGRIYVDYLRNGWGASIVAAYSTRSRPGAPVSTPVSWEELAAGARPQDFDVRTVPARLRAAGDDPWEGYAEASRQGLKHEMERGLGLC